MLFICPVGVGEDTQLLLGPHSTLGGFQCMVGASIELDRTSPNAAAGNSSNDDLLYLVRRRVIV